MPQSARDPWAIVSCRIPATAQGFETVSRWTFRNLDEAVRHVMSAMTIDSRELAWIICADGRRLDFRDIANVFEQPGFGATGSAYVI